MFTLLKLIQSLTKTLHSEGTRGQVAAGSALGATLGFTPLVNVHNLIVFSLIVLLNVSFGGGMLGWALFVPDGFLLDPVSDRIGASLLQAWSLRPLRTAWYHTPLVPYTNFNNSVVLGSVVGRLVLAMPIFCAARWAVARAKVGSIVIEKVEPVKQRIAAVEVDGTGRLAQERQRLDQVDADLPAELTRLTGGLAPENKLPKIKLSQRRSRQPGEPAPRSRRHPGRRRYSPCSRPRGGCTRPSSHPATRRVPRGSVAAPYASVWKPIIMHFFRHEGRKEVNACPRGSGGVYGRAPRLMPGQSAVGGASRSDCSQTAGGRKITVTLPLAESRCASQYPRRPPPASGELRWCPSPARN